MAALTPRQGVVLLWLAVILSAELAGWLQLFLLSSRCSKTARRRAGSMGFVSRGISSLSSFSRNRDELSLLIMMAGALVSSSALMAVIPAWSHPDLGPGLG
tara:strand:+ start:5301 stop:5603 length:303 start_codon:yes stop_codon:yes gene_type:complete